MLTALLLLPFTYWKRTFLGLLVCIIMLFTVAGWTAEPPVTLANDATPDFFKKPTDALRHALGGRGAL